MPEYDVAAFDALPDGVAHPIEIEQTAILLIRSGQTVTAIGATCPHAGAPLAEGVLAGDRIICPWHKAAFCVRSGALLDPPAVDGLPRYKVRRVGDRIHVTLPAEDAAGTSHDKRDDRRLFAIIGAGGAGAMAAQTLRAAGFGGRIVMLDRENRVPYDRTLLSKYHLSGVPGAEKTPLQSQAFYQQQGIERRTAEVVSLDAGSREIVCADGSRLTYDAALLATGAVPVRPQLPGSDRKNVFVLRSRADADAILAQAERSRRAVVLGASFIGMEVAASLRERGLDVAVVGKEHAPFEKQLGARIGGAFVGLHRTQGVTFHLGQEVGTLDGDSEVRSVTLSDGQVLAADLVVIGFGVKPAAIELAGVGLNDDGSVTVDANLQAADGFYAAGDIARFPLTGIGAPIRVEHWRVAQQHGRVAALNMAGDPVRYTSMPVFWTIQYLKRLDYIGHATDWDEIIVHGDLEQPEFLAYYVKDGLVKAAAALDRDRDSAALIHLFERQRDWTPAALGAEPYRLLVGSNRDQAAGS